MPPDPQVEALRAVRAAAGQPPLYELSVAEARQADLEAVQAEAGVPEPVRHVTDLTAPGPAGPIPLRHYAPSDERPLPALVYFFGGGWVLGSLETSDPICRSLANRSGCAVVAAQYRLAPEHPYPAAVEDCWAATTWIAENAAELGLDPERLAVGGDSAGGNLAAVVARRARDRGGPPLRFQLLVYPVTDHDADTPSMRAEYDPLFFNPRSMAWYWGHYLRDPAQGAEPDASPLRAASFAGLPPALVITAGLDPLCDEAEQYAARMEAAGVPVELLRYGEMIHGFFAMTAILDAGREAHERAAAALAAALRQG